MESPSSKDFIKTQFFGADNMTRPDPLGVYLDATTGADFALDTNIAAFVPPKNQSNAVISTLIQALADLDIVNDAAVDAFSRNWFDIDYFFRAIAVEYLAGSYDSYWFMTTNFVVYNDPTESTPTTNKFYFIDQDFDQSFGVNLSPIYNPYGANYTKISYTAYVNKTWSVVGYDAPRRTMVDRLLSNPTYRTKFESILKTIVEGVYNPIALGRRIDAISNRIRPDMAWDIGLGVDNRAHHGNATVALVWTLADFDNGFTTSIGGNWGLKTFISERSEFVASEFGITFIDPPLTPPMKNCTIGENDVTTGTVPVSTGTSTDAQASSAVSISFAALTAVLLSAICI